MNLSRNNANRLCRPLGPVLIPSSVKKLVHQVRDWFSGRCDENGPAAALLLSHVSIQICSFVAPCRRPILIATPLNQSRTWCTRAGNESLRILSQLRYRRRIALRETALMPVGIGGRCG